jgi:hypothetical protein
MRLYTKNCPLFESIVIFPMSDGSITLGLLRNFGDVIQVDLVIGFMGSGFKGNFI